MQRIAAALVLLVACVSLPRSPSAQGLPAPRTGEAPFELSADSVEYESEREIYLARGSVRLRQGDRTLSADWMAFSNVTQRGVASGNVVFTDRGETLYTEFVEFDIGTLQGVLFEGRFASQENQFRLEGAEIARTGEDTYAFREGLFTTCRCPEQGRDPWRIRASEAELEIGGYGTARNTTFEILHVPVIWLPWMIYPLKTERQSGFLLPEVGYGSRNGFEVGLPFFWAVGDPVNLTLTPKWLEKRGAKGELEVEYVVGERSWGEVFGAFVHDEQIDAHSPSEPFGRERWAVQGREDLFLPLGVRLRSAFAFVSDNRYPADFDEMRGRRSDRFLESTVFAGRRLGSSDRYGLVASAVYADDLQSPDDLDRDRFLLQRLPRLDLSVLPGRSSALPWLVPALDVDYTRFGARRDRSDLPDAFLVGDRVFLDTGIDGLLDARERGPGGRPQGSLPDGSGDNAPGGPEGDGRFQEGEILADRGHRVRFAPRIGLPLRLADAVELYPEVGWQQTLYQTDAQGFEQWGALIGRAELRTRFARRFAGGARHLIEPRLGYAVVTEHGQGGKPLFIPPTAVPQRRIRQLALDNVVLDPADRVERFHGLTFGFANRVFGRSAAGRAPRLLADFAVSGQYEFTDGAFGEVLLDGRAYPWARTRAKFNLGFDPEEGRLEEALAELRWSSAGGHRVSLGYRYLRKIPRFFEDFRFANERFDDFESSFNRVNQIDAGLRLAITQRWSATYRAGYAFERSLLLKNEGGIEYLSGCRCWAVRLEVRQDRMRGVQFHLLYSLVGLGEKGSPFARGGGLGGSDFLDAF